MFLSLLAPKDFTAGGTGPLFCIISGGYWAFAGSLPRPPCGLRRTRQDDSSRRIFLRLMLRRMGFSLGDMVITRPV
jgi:hypothetical protein